MRVEIDAGAAVDADVDDGNADDGGAPPSSGPAIETYRVLHWNIAGGQLRAYWGKSDTDRFAAFDERDQRHLETLCGDLGRQFAADVCD